MRKRIGVISDGKYVRLDEPIVIPGVGRGMGDIHPFKPTKFETLEGEPVIRSNKQLKEICDKKGLRSRHIENTF